MAVIELSAQLNGSSHAQASGGKLVSLESHILGRAGAGTRGAQPQPQPQQPQQSQPGAEKPKV